MRFSPPRVASQAFGYNFMILRISCDDGSLEDFKLACLLKIYSLPCIFYIPTCSELSANEIVLLYNMGFEIGGHTKSHFQDLKLLGNIEQEEEILSNKLYLESIIGKDKIKSFCYPRGRYNDKTVEIVKKCGFTEARTTVTGNTDLPDDPFRVKTSVHVYPDWFNEKFNKPDWFKEAKKLYKEAQSKGDLGYFHLWMHSYELTKFKLWEELETFFKIIAYENRN